MDFVVQYRFYVRVRMDSAYEETTDVPEMIFPSSHISSTKIYSGIYESVQKQNAFLAQTQENSCKTSTRSVEQIDIHTPKMSIFLILICYSFVTIYTLGNTISFTTGRRRKGWKHTWWFIQQNTFHYTQGKATEMRYI